MQIETLVEFVELCHLLSFERTAVKLNVTESGLSKRMTALEKEVGFPLFASRRKVSLTPAGKAFFAKCIKILVVYEEALRECRDMAKRQVREVRVFSHPTKFEEMRILSQGISLFKRNRPNALISFAPPSDMTEYDAVGKTADLAITMDYESDLSDFASSDSKSVTAIFLVKCPLVALVRADHFLAGKESLTRVDLEAFSFAMPASKSLDFLRRPIYSMAMKLGLHLEYRSFPASSIEEIALTMDVDNAILLTPAMADPLIGDGAGDFVALPISDKKFALSLYLLCREDWQEDTALCELVESIRSVAHAQNDGLRIETKPHDAETV